MSEMKFASVCYPLPFPEQGLALGTPLPAVPAVAARPAVMDVQRMAQAQRAIDALWDAYDNKASEVGDAQV